MSRLRAEPFLQELEAKGNSDDFVCFKPAVGGAGVVVPWPRWT